MSHKISSKVIEVDRANIEIIEELPPPILVKGVGSILGHVGFYRRFIDDFFEITKPFANLLVQSTHSIFDKACEKAFTTLKKKFVSEPVALCMWCG